jgi:hypothetical protein
MLLYKIRQQLVVRAISSSALLHPVHKQNREGLDASTNTLVALLPKYPQSQNDEGVKPLQLLLRHPVPVFKLGTDQSNGGKSCIGVCC